MSASIRAEEKNHGRYIIRRDENLKRGDGRQLVSHCIFGDFIRRRLGFDYPVYPGAFDCARLNAVTDWSGPSSSARVRVKPTIPHFAAE